MIARPGPLAIASLSLILGAGVYMAPVALWAAASAAVPDPVQVTSISDPEEGVRFREPIVEATMDPMEEVYQQQLLQQEVQELRGLVEELSEQITQMNSRQADRYQDLDRRIEDLRLMLNEVAPAGRAATARPTDPRSPDGIASGGRTPDAVAAGGARDEKLIYDTALEMIRNRQYESAIVQLQEVINSYPTGEYAPNAYYWLGEVYAALPEPDYEKARQALAQVISFFPDNRKVPDAAFKLGKVYHLMGDCQRATELLNQVITQYQNKAVAKLAESYLSEKVDCAR